MVNARRGVISPRGDFLWFAFPGLVAAIVAVGLGLVRNRPPDDVGIGLWIAGILLVDVAHVWSTLFRTYLDPTARERHASRLWQVPVGCLIGGFLVHLQSPVLFWRVLAYIAIFHFIKQHVGFALIFARLNNEGDADRRLIRLAVWAGTLAPVVWWHAHLPRRFEWFMEGDLIGGLPPSMGTLALLLPIPLWIAFCWRRLSLARRGQGNAMAVWLTVLPAINWHLGIVVFNDDRVFTITNVFMHGVPYMALVWISGARERVEPAVSRLVSRHVRLASLAVFYLAIVALAFIEEGLWDRLLWHDHPELFGHGLATALDPNVEALVVALLTLPQATHYMLDRWIWRVGPDNPHLARQLNMAS